MTKQRRVLIALSFGTSAAVALAVWLLGPQGATTAIGLVTAAIGAISGLLGWLVPQSPAPDEPAPGRRGVAPAPGGADAAHAPGGAHATVQQNRRLEPPGTRRRRWLVVVAASLAPVVIVAAVVLLLRQLDNERRSDPGQAHQPTQTPGPAGRPGVDQPASGQPGDSSQPAEPTAPGPTHLITPIVDTLPPTPPPTRPPPTRRPTTAPPESSKPAQPWIPPAATPEWTLYDTDGVRFLPMPSRQPAQGYPEMTFQFDPYRQVNWYQWTDSPDLSYQGCRSASAARWDSIKLEDFTTPRTYCRREPADPSKVAYVQFTAKNMTADPPYVKVKVWIHGP